jgi:hypothetical protein
VQSAVSSLPPKQGRLGSAVGEIVCNPSNRHLLDDTCQKQSVAVSHMRLDQEELPDLISPSSGRRFHETS